MELVLAPGMGVDANELSVRHSSVGGAARETRRMTDVWDSEELFGTFVHTRILPGRRQLGIPGQPDMITQAAHEVTAVDGTWT